MLLPALGFLGVLISAYVWFKQVTTGPVLCIGSGCAAVIRSKYGRLLGIPNGALGVAYFLGVSIAVLVTPRFPLAVHLTLAASLVALILYGYLTYLQFFVLRTLCSWCISSAGLTAVIFVLLLRAV